jgi:hypothetical protein
MNEKLWAYSMENMVDKLSNGSEYRVYDKKSCEDQELSLKMNMSLILQAFKRVQDDFSSATINSDYGNKSSFECWFEFIKNIDRF